MNAFENLLKEFFAGSVGSLAKILTIVENEMEGELEILKQLYMRTGNAYIIGITGPPGSGKSTLTEKITQELRKINYTVGIIAVDPTSPFSGGAVLGDRCRMKNVLHDGGVFVRSMATRRALGGLSNATADAIKVLDAFGKHFILVETVGVGQDEVDIVETADSTVLVSVPGLGDGVQALKAGVMEIGDIFVVNKSDRDGADQVAFELRTVLDMNHYMEGGWRPPIIKTIGTEGKGVFDLVGHVLAHKQFLEESNLVFKKRKARVREEVISMINNYIFNYVSKKIKYDQSFTEEIEEIIERKKDPYTYVQKIVNRYTAPT